MSAENDSPGFFAKLESNDNLLYGCGMGCLVQLAFGILGLLVGLLLGFDYRNQSVIIAFSSWGVTQWIGLIPLIVHQRATGRPFTVLGVIITGGIGLLLSSACAGTFLPR